MSQETTTLKENSPIQQQMDQDAFASMNVFNFLLNKLNGTIRSSPESLSLDENILPSSLIYPVYNKNIDYCHEFWQLYLENELIVAQMKDQVHQSKEVQARIHKLERKNHPHHVQNNQHKNEHNNDHHHNDETGEHIKKKRRAANEIEKIYNCPYQGCDRSYGSDVSLNLHIKIKHNGGSKTERERLVKMILEAKIQHKELPEINLNLPPTFLQDIKIERILKGKDHNKENQDSNIENGNLSEMDISNILKELNRAVDLHQLQEEDLKMNNNNS